MLVAKKATVVKVHSGLQEGGVELTTLATMAQGEGWARPRMVTTVRGVIVILRGAPADDKRMEVLMDPLSLSLTNPIT